MKSIPLSILLVTTLFCTSAIALAGNSIPKSYPLKTCPVSGDKLGGDGEPVKVSYKGTDVYLCCQSCKKDFAKNPAKYAKIVQEAASKK